MSVLIKMITDALMKFAAKETALATVEKNPIVRAYRMSLARLATELAVALIVIAILVGGIAAGIFFAANTSGWDTTSALIWPYIFPLALAALLVGILAHMYTESTQG